MSPPQIIHVWAVFVLCCRCNQSADALLQINNLHRHLHSFTDNKSSPKQKVISTPPKVPSTKRYASPSQLRSSNNDSAQTHSNSPLPSNIPPWIRTLSTFAIGYGIGTASAPGWQRHDKLTSKIGLTKIALIVLIIRDVWRSTPEWARPRIVRYGKGIGRWVGAPFRRRGVVGVMEEEEVEAGDVDDITDLSNFATKLQGVMDTAKRKLALEENESRETQQQLAHKIDIRKDQITNDFDIRASLLALIQLQSQVKYRNAKLRDELYQSSGTAVPNEMLEGMDEMFELADLAYNEHKDGDIKTVLKGMGYELLKHDTTSVPGYLGHYIALKSNPSSIGEKVAIIGVKGTSNFEDFLTDMCASSVEYNLTNPFYDGGSKTLRCHEGVFISSRRLAEDLLPFVTNLLLPSGYKIIVVGHSLGAGCATVFSLLLRASIPSLRNGDNLKVWAFASPPVLDLDSALGCSSFVATVVNNCDVVPRANISTLLVMARMMRAVDQRLKERNLDMSNFKSTVAFLNMLKEGKQGEMLMTEEEVASVAEKAFEKKDLNDPDHLYVPGKVVLMYNLWEKEQKEELEQKEMEQDFSNTFTDWRKKVETINVHSNLDGGLKSIPTAEEAVLCDGTCDVLNFLEFDGKLLDDHMAPQYRSSIANIISLKED